MISRYSFSLSVPDGGVVHLVTSSSATGEEVGVVVSIKSCPSTGGDSTQLNRVVWGHWLVDPSWIAPKPWTTSQWLKVTCSHTVSLSSTTLPAKRQRSGLLGSVSFSAQYCRPLVQATIRRVGCCHTSWHDNSSGRKAFLLSHLGAGGTVYFCSRKALILTSGI